MNKRITSIVLSFVMLFTMLATAVPALAAAPVQLKVTADATSANPGDTINYTVSVGAVTNMGGLEFKLIIPSGLTIVDSSISIPTGLETTIDSDGAIVVPSSKNGYKWSYSAQSAGYTGASDLEILSFACTVDNGASGNKNVTIKVDTFFDNDELDEFEYEVTNSVVSVTAAPKPATDISLNKSTLELTVGESETLVATVTPADTTDTVTWDTGRSDIATVDSTGKVTAVAPGTAVIAARAGEKSAFCTVTVVAAPCTHANKTNVDAKSSTCKEQGWEAYSKCDDCGQLFDAEGNEISAIPYLSLADHTPAQTAAAEYLKSAATCTSPAVYYEHCSVCDEKLNTTFTSGSTVPHTESGWKSDADGHWKECTVCNAITTAKVAHTPDHEGHATEEYAIKCTECSWEIEAQLGHTHVFDKEVATDAYKASDATCTAKATYYKSCACGEKGTATFEYGELAAHNPASVWTSDASGHWHACQTAGCTEKCDFAAHTPDHEGNATEEYAIKCTECDYVIEAQLTPRTPVTNIAATITAPALGQTPDCAPVIVANPTDSVDLEEVVWYKIAVADFTGAYEDTWDAMEADEVFEDGYYYSVDLFFDTNDGYKMSESATGTVNGMPHDDTYGELYEGDSAAYLCGLFEPLAVEYTIDLPVSLIVKLTGDKKPAKETFKFEIYDLGCEDAVFEIVNDSVVVENLEFDENGVAFAGGIIKIKVTGEDQLWNLTEGFSVRMVKGSTKGWTYASEQWRIEPFFENDALDLVITVKEIVDGEISEEYANGMSFAVSYEAVSEPDPTEPDPIKPDPIKPDPTEPDPTEPDPTEPDPTEPDPTEPTESDPNTGAPDDVPQTGDNSNMILWIALLLASGLGVTGTVVYSKRKKYAE